MKTKKLVVNTLDHMEDSMLAEQDSILCVANDIENTEFNIDI